MISAFVACALLLWGPAEFEPAHAIYISVVEIEAQRVRVKVFQDDLRDAIRNVNQGKITSTNTLCGAEAAVVERYFQDKLKIVINGAPADIAFQNSSAEGDSYWITFDLKAPETWQSIRVEDRHFMEMFPTQSNIIKVVNPKQHFCRLSRGDSVCQFEF